MADEILACFRTPGEPRRLVGTAGCRICAAVRSDSITLVSLGHAYGLAHR